MANSKYDIYDDDDDENVAKRAHKNFNTNKND